jgi:hypothetical protein
MPQNEKRKMPRIVIEPRPPGLLNARRIERPLQLTRDEKNGIADLMISHAGVIAAATELLLKSGPDEARAKLEDGLELRVEHVADHRHARRPLRYPFVGMAELGHTAASASECGQHDLYRRPLHRVLFRHPVDKSAVDPAGRQPAVRKLERMDVVRPRAIDPSPTIDRASTAASPGARSSAPGARHRETSTSRR